MPHRTASKAPNGDDADNTGAAQPPSTLAAQIKNGSDGNGRKQQVNSELFAQLLDEIETRQDALELDVLSNFKLLSIVIEAGLVPLTRDDPFLPADEAASRAVACLDLVRAVVKRVPVVLFDDGYGMKESKAPLCLTLIPLLLLLLNKLGDGRIHESLQKTLESFRITICQNSRHWELLPLLIRSYQAYAEDILSILDLSSPPTNDKVLAVDLPSALSRATIIPHIQQSVATQQGKKVQFQNSAHAVDACMSLIAALTPATNDAGVAEASLFILDACQTWILQSLLRLWNHLKHLDEPDKLNIHEDFFTVLSIFHLRSIRKANARILRHATVKLVIECVIDSMKLKIFEEPRFRTHVATALSTVFRCRQYQDRIFMHARNQLRGFDISKVDTDSLPDTAGKQIVMMIEALISYSIITPRVSENLGPSAEEISAQIVGKHFETMTELNLEIPEDLTTSPSRPAKRLKRDTLNSSLSVSNRANKLILEFCTLLGGWELARMIDLPLSAADLYCDLSNSEKAAILQILGSFFCVETYTCEEGDLEKGLTSCNICDTNSSMEINRKSSAFDDILWNSLHDTLAALVNSPAIKNSRRLQILAMIALGRLLSHTPVSSHMDLTISRLGKWCLQSLRVSFRELRVVASRTLAIYLRGESQFDDKICKKNRIVALDLLRKLAESRDSRLCETVIMALGHLARVCGDEEMNLVLLQLVECLGHTNPLVCGVASVELEQLAQASGKSLPELIRPFWRSVAIAVVKDISTKPQKAQQLSDLLGISVNQLLIQTQSETTPYLVLWGKRDILQRIVHARGGITSTLSLCMDLQNLTQILALLMTQQTSNPETAIVDSLRQISPEFGNETLSNLLKVVDSIALACEILRVAGDEGGASKTKAINAFHEFTAILERKGHTTRTATTQARITSIFFENHSLGIMTSFSDLIDAPNQPNMVKKRCLRGIREMIEIAKLDVRVALPQIRACLLSALEIRELTNDAFCTWASLLKSLNSDEDLGTLVDLTFTTIVQNWAFFDTKTQEQAHDAVASLLKDHSRLIQDSVNFIPSLASIPLMTKFESQLGKIRSTFDVGTQLAAFSQRCKDENSSVVLQAVRELQPYLETHQQWIHDSAASSLPSVGISTLLRSLLDTCLRFNEDSEAIVDLCAQCIGTIGCLDSNRIEAIRDVQDMLVLSNFTQASQAIDFVVFLLENVLVKAFHSVSNPRAQGFLAYAMQELLKFSGLTKDSVFPNRLQGTQAEDSHLRWLKFPESVRNSLAPFLNSRYVLNINPNKNAIHRHYPIYNSHSTHSTWLRDFTLDLLQRSDGDNARQIFEVLSRIIRGYDLSIAATLLPFAAANIIIGGSNQKASEDVRSELYAILQDSTTNKSTTQVENMNQCSENVFQVLDYLSRWLQEKKRAVANDRILAQRAGKVQSAAEQNADDAQIRRVELLLSFLPAEATSRRAVECKSYARALLHWEEYIREVRTYAVDHPDTDLDEDILYQRLQDIYTQIDEGDGLDGVSSLICVLSPEQQALQHCRAGRWSVSQTWYELQLRKDPTNEQSKLDLLCCLQQAGQYPTIMIQSNIFASTTPLNPDLVSIAAQAAWYTESWSYLEALLPQQVNTVPTEFNAGLGAAMLKLQGQNHESFDSLLKQLRLNVAKSLSTSTTSSLQACHDQMLKLHVLYECQFIGKISDAQAIAYSNLHSTLNRRLDGLGSATVDKQYLLGIRRALMRRCAKPDAFSDSDIAASWMKSAKLARKSNNISLAYDAILHATGLGDDSASIEKARLLWKEGEHRKAIRSLETAINDDALGVSEDQTLLTAQITSVASTTVPNPVEDQQNLKLARAQLLLAIWLDEAGQTSSSVINARYQEATKSYGRWEKSLHHLGSYYNKLHEAEKAKPLSRQHLRYLSGETTKLVVENYMRSLVFGCKYLFESLPKLLTLWLDFGAEVGHAISKEVSDDIRNTATDMRPRNLEMINRQVKKYMERIPVYVIYTSLAQMLTRISHPHLKTYEQLANMITRIVSVHPQQALWSLLAVVKSTNQGRVLRGMSIIKKVKEQNTKIRHEGASVELRNIVTQGEKLSAQLLDACMVPLDHKTPYVSLTKDLRFNVKVAPCPLVIPLEKTLSASLPTVMSSLTVRANKAFPDSRNAITVYQFYDEVLVLSSLQKPRKLTVRGSDGKRYGLLCKPNDDLRKDQRLMEFNTMINRALKKDAESSKRRLYIKTYAVTPLNETCGVIEWVEGLKPMRDILIGIYKAKGIKVDYALLRELLNQACASPTSWSIFPQQILPMYKPVLHEWFTELFPAPDVWFIARTRYTRSCAIASMVGHALGLGDRHGENVLLEEHSGGIFHVDFNCLFDKGLAFEKPELVPFRLTHNMVDAFGATGVEGMFRRAAECGMAVMRANEDALLTILETFVYDPTADFVGPRKKVTKGVPETPREVLESVGNKVRGLMRGESMPLSVEGHVDALIRQATDPINLSAMYIGWCAFL